MKEKVTKVCIDDSALHKRYTYGTVMVDLETHRDIVLLGSRGTDDVTEWLKSYPNVNIVSRDGSGSYHSAIQQTNKDILQVSNRFHLLKGFTDAAKKFWSGFWLQIFHCPRKPSMITGQKQVVIGTSH